MKTAFLFFIALTIINTAIFYKRDHFQYIPVSSYEELYQPCNSTCERKWSGNNPTISNAELLEAKQILSENHLDTGTTLTKILNIGSHLYKKLYQRSGAPSAEVNNSTPLQQYKIFVGDTSKDRWCSNYAQIFNFFCEVENILCRPLEIMQPGNHHIISECYIPELKQWVAVDLLNKVFLATHKKKFLNAVSLNEALRSSKEVHLLSLEAGQVIETPVNIAAADMECYLKQYPIYYYHRADLKEIYSPVNKLKHYILPVSWYEIYTPTPESNMAFYTKGFCLIAWFTSLAFLIIKYRTYDRSKRFA